MKKFITGLLFGAMLLFSTNSNAQAMGADIDEGFDAPTVDCHQEIIISIQWYWFGPVYTETMITVCD